MPRWAWMDRMLDRWAIVTWDEHNGVITGRNKFGQRFSIRHVGDLYELWLLNFCPEGRRFCNCAQAMLGRYPELETAKDRAAPLGEGRR